MTMTISGTEGFTFPDASQLNSSSQVVKAWVNFNGTGTVVIRAAYNVSSVTDLGTGLYAVNVIVPFVDIDYIVCVDILPSRTDLSAFGSGSLRSGVKLVGSIQLATVNQSDAAFTDFPEVCAAFFR